MSDVTEQLDDLQQSVDEHDNRLDSVDDTLSQHDDSINDHEDRLTDQDQTIQDVSDRAGQLDFPITQDTIDRIKECFPTGTISLSSGTATLTDARIDPSSTILFSHLSFAGVPVIALGDTQYCVKVVPGNGSAVFTSSSSSDSSTLSYVIF